MSDNIYTDLGLSLEKPATDVAALKAEIIRKAQQWKTNAATDVKAKEKIIKAEQWLTILDELPQKEDLAATARQTKAQEIDLLKRTVKELQRDGKLLDDEIEYLKLHFDCFDGDTIDWFIQEALEEQRNTAGNFHEEILQQYVVQYGKPLIFATGLIVAFLAGLWFISGLFSCVLSHKMGTYPNLDYSKMEWKEVKMLDGFKPRDFYGADKNHWVVCDGHQFLIYKSGSWSSIQLQNCVIRKNFQECFITYEDEIGYFDDNKNFSSYQLKKFPNAVNSNCTLVRAEKNLYFIGTPNSNAIMCRGHMFTELKNDDKRLYVWNGSENCGSIFYLLVSTYNDHCTIGVNPSERFIAKYQGESWAKIYEISQDDSRGIWALDDKNFILYGNGITMFRNGVESHTAMSVVGFPPDAPFQTRECCAVWGQSLDHFWVADTHGNIVEYSKGTFSKVKVGPSSSYYNYCHIFILQDGTVFYSDTFYDSLYRLE